MSFRTEAQNKYGLGTLVLFGNDERWLIIELQDGKAARLNLHTLNVDASVVVKDTSWLSRLEFDLLFDSTGCTFTDFTMHPLAKLDNLEKYKY